MWVAIFIVAFSLLLILLAPKPKIENARAGSLGDFRFPRSSEGDPVPWFLGTVRLRSPNALWYGDFDPVPITKKQKTGLFSSKRVTVGYKYHIGLDLCWGLAGNSTVRLRKLWSDKHVFFDGNISTASTLTINLPNLFGGEEQRGGLVGRIDFYPGSFNETRNAYLMAEADPQVPAYIGHCRTVFRGAAIVSPSALPLSIFRPRRPSGNNATGFYFGTTTNINAIQAEMTRLSSNVSAAFSVMPNGLDVNPMEVLYAGFTERFGMPGLSPTNIDMASWQRDAQTLFNEGFGMSLLIQRGISGKDLAEEVLRIADGILYQDSDTGLMVSRLIREDYVVANLPIIDESIVLDLTNFSKTTWEQTYNQCRVTFKDRSNLYADKVATAQDFANINFQQRVKNIDISMPSTFVADEANRLAVRQLSLLSVPLFQIELRCNRRASLYKPADLFIFNYAPYGISNMVMRVQKIEKGTLLDGVVTINAVQDRFATALAVFAPPGGSGWINPIGLPTAMVPEALFELPYEMSEAEGAVIATIGSRPQAGDLGYKIFAGETAITLEEIGQIDTFTPSGLLTAPYPFSTAARDAVGFAVGTVRQADDVDGGTEDELLAGASVALIRSSAGDELIAFRTFNGTQVGDVIRGIFGTVPLSHPSGATVFFITSGFGMVNEESPLTVTPFTVHAKLLPFSSRGQLALATAAPLSVVAINKAQRPAVPGRVRVNGVAPGSIGLVTGAFIVAWAQRTRLDIQVRTQAEGSVTAELGTTYNLRVFNNATNALLASGLLGDAVAAQVRLSFSGQVRVELEASRLGLASYTAQRVVFDYAPAGELLNNVVFDLTSIIFDGGRP